MKYIFHGLRQYYMLKFYPIYFYIHCTYLFIKNKSLWITLFINDATEGSNSKSLVEGEYNVFRTLVAVKSETIILFYNNMI